MEPDELEFSTVKEHRDWYFVEYYPPRGADWLASLNIVVLGAEPEDRVVGAMEAEARRWITRYPSPLMASAFGEAGDLISLDGLRDSDHLMAHLDAGSGDPRLEWRLIPEAEVPGKLLTDDERLRVYADVSHTYTSAAAREQEFRKFARSFRTGRRLITVWLIVWLAAIPAGWAILQWAGPRWLGVGVLIYSLFKALQQVLKLIGVWRPSRRERESEEKRKRMEEYYLECERNPEGFERLKLENLEREAREQTQNEARVLRGREEST
jgi:hypothetical protein